MGLLLSILSVLGWLLLGLLGLLLVVLLVPAQARVAGWARLEGDEHDGAGGSFRVAWGGGLVSLTGAAGEGLWFRLLGRRIKRLRPREARPPRPRPERRKPEKPRSGRGGAWFWRHRSVLLRASLRLLHTLHFQGSLRGVLGLDDPSDTALCHALLGGAARAGLGVEVELDYLEARLDLAGELRLRAWPVELLAVGLAQILKPELRAALRDKV